MRITIAIVPQIAADLPMNPTTDDVSDRTMAIRPPMVNALATVNKNIHFLVDNSAPTIQLGPTKLMATMARVSITRIPRRVTRDACRLPRPVHCPRIFPKPLERQDHDRYEDREEHEKDDELNHFGKLHPS